MYVRATAATGRAPREVAWRARARISAVCSGAGGRASAAEVRAKLAAGAKIVDVRTPEEFRGGAYVNPLRPGALGPYLRGAVWFGAVIGYMALLGAARGVLALALAAGFTAAQAQ